MTSTETISGTRSLYDRLGGVYSIATVVEGLRGAARARIGVGTTGPGAVHLLNGLYDAHMDGAPVVAITGMTFHDLIGTRYQQVQEELAWKLLEWERVQAGDGLEV